MPAYLVPKIAVTEPERWAAYRDAVVPLIEAFGGRRATKAGGARLLEGEGAATVSIYEFPSTSGGQGVGDAVRDPLAATGLPHRSGLVGRRSGDGFASGAVTDQ